MVKLILDKGGSSVSKPAPAPTGKPASAPTSKPAPAPTSKPAPAPTSKPQTPAQTQAAAIRADKQATSAVIASMSPPKMPDLSKPSPLLVPPTTTKKPPAQTTPRPSEIWDIITPKPVITTTKKPVTVTTPKPTTPKPTTSKPTTPKPTPSPDYDLNLPTEMTPIDPTPPGSSAPVRPTPPSPPVLRQDRSSSEVISARPDIMQDDFVIPPEILIKLLFEDIGAQELLLLSRHDVLNGKKIAYQPISNIGDIEIAYGADAILSAADSFKNYFKNFKIFLESYVEEFKEYSGAPNSKVVPISGALSLEFRELRSDHRVEIQTAQFLNLFDDTIY
jgi:hypothetical protein